MCVWRCSFMLVLLSLMPSAASAATEVDLELVLAVDISYSMDPEELSLQREGYILALTSQEVLSAIKDGIHGKIAVSYVEWAGSETQHVVVGWTLVEGLESARAFTSAIGEASIQRAFRTSISSALEFTARMFDSNGFEGLRRVIDVSGDGPNNQGPIITRARDETVAKGITINGLPLVFKKSGFAFMDLEDLAGYYTKCVTGGPGSFVVPVADKSQFAESIRTKLVLEIAAAPVTESPRRPLILKAQASSEIYECTVGERLWQQRYGR